MSLPSDAKEMRLRYAGVCRLCGSDLPARAEAVYERSTKTVRCVECPTDMTAGGMTEEAETAPHGEQPFDAPVEDSGAAGSSARREYERRKARDQQRLRQKWGKLGGIAVALSDEKQSTTAWATGAAGEERLGARLDSLASESIAVLHDRRIPGTKANIDHIAITAAGIWVIDAKRYKGRPELKVEGGILRPRVEKVLGRSPRLHQARRRRAEADRPRPRGRWRSPDQGCALLRRGGLAAHRRRLHHQRRPCALAQATREAADRGRGISRRACDP